MLPLELESYHENGFLSVLTNPPTFPIDWLPLGFLCLLATIGNQQSRGDRP